jgi:hypothetical protein
MPKYAITITATVTKTYEVEEFCEGKAIETAHEIFSVLNEDGIEEKYDQETVRVEQIG